MNIFAKTATAFLAADAIGGEAGELTQASASSSSAGTSVVAQSPVGDAAGESGDLNAAASRGVDVTNMSGNTMRLKSVTGDQWFEGDRRMAMKSAQAAAIASRCNCYTSGTTTRRSTTTSARCGQG